MKDTIFIKFLIKKISTLLLLFLVFFISSSANASTIYLESQVEKFGPGDSFSVDVKIDTNQVCVNTADVKIVFPTNYLQVRDFLTGDSFLSLWIEKPNSKNFSGINKTGILHFTGGIPGGYCGVIPGDPGESNILGRIIFESPSFAVGERNDSEISISIADDSRVLLNDGLGTEDALEKNSIKLAVLDSPTLSSSDYRTQLKNDNIPPEPFIIYLQGGNRAFNGANYIEFNTTDKQTGVDRYELLEIWENEQVGVPVERTVFDYFMKKKRMVPEWKVIKSPYLLVDQDLRSIIRLRAIDKAGNERNVEYIPEGSIKKQQNQILYRKLFVILLMVVAGLILMIVLWLAVRKILKRRRASDDSGNDSGEINDNNNDESSDVEDIRHKT
jgi:hypothetical protein